MILSRSLHPSTPHHEGQLSVKLGNQCDIPLWVSHPLFWIIHPLSAVSPTPSSHLMLLHPTQAEKKTTLANPPYLSPRQIQMNCSLLILMQIFTSEWEHLLPPLSEGHFSPCLPVGLLPSKNILVGFHSTLNLLPNPIKRASRCPLCTISHCDSLAYYTAQ